MSKFEPLPSSPEKVDLYHDRDSMMISHDESLEMENSWAMEFDEVPTLESVNVDAKINTLESEGKCSPSTESEPSVPVNLTC